MSNDNGVIRSISWRDLCPWTILFRTFSLALNPNIILLATAGVFLSCCAWFVPAKLFIDESNLNPQLLNVVEANASPYRRATESPFEGLAEPVRGESDTSEQAATTGVFADPTEGMSLKGRKGIPGVFWDYVDSFYYMFDFRSGAGLETSARLQLFAYFLFGGLLTVAIWSVLGGAITRIAILRLARDEGCGLVDSVKFALQRFVAYFTGPIIPMAFVLVLGLIVGLFALFMMADWGVIFVGIFWLIVLLIGFLMAFLLVGLMFGWPMMFPTISSESSDAFDAISRCYAYVLQRPITYGFYVLVSVVFGGLCWWLANLFGEEVIAMADWSASWGAGSDRMDRIHELIDGAAAGEDEGTLSAGASIIGFFNGFLRTAVTGYTYGLFWCLASAMYLLMRKVVDDTEFDEVFVEGEDDYGLPPLTNDPPAESQSATASDSEDVATSSVKDMKDEPKSDSKESGDDDKSDDDEN